MKTYSVSVQLGVSVFLSLFGSGKVAVKNLGLKGLTIYFDFYISRKIFPEGAPVIYDGEDFVCEICDVASPKKQSSFEEVERQAPPSYEHHVQATPLREPLNLSEDSENCKCQLDLSIKQLQ